MRGRDPLAILVVARVVEQPQRQRQALLLGEFLLADLGAGTAALAKLAGEAPKVDL